MKILLCVSDLGYRGTPRCVRECALAYRRGGHDVSIFSYLQGGEVAEELRVDQFNVFIGKESVQQGLAFCPDILHLHRHGAANAYESELILLFKKNGAKAIETSVFGWFDNSDGGKALDLSLQISLWNLYRWNRWRGNRRGMGVYIPNIVATEEMCRVSEVAIQEYRALLRIPQNAFVIGRIGKTHWPWVSRYIYPLIKANSNLFFLSVGDYGSSEAESILKTEEFSRIIQISKLPRYQLPTFYSACTVMLNVSPIGESFGFVIAEAMSCGTPVVSVSTPFFDDAQVEVIQHGTGGFVAATPQHLSTVLQTLITHPEKVGVVQKNCRHLIQSRYSREVISPRLNKLIEIVRNYSEVDLMGKLKKEGYMTQVSAKTILSSLSVLDRPTNVIIILIMRVLHAPLGYLARVTYSNIRASRWASGLFS